MTQRMEQGGERLDKCHEVPYSEYLPETLCQLSSTQTVAWHFDRNRSGDHPVSSVPCADKLPQETKSPLCGPPIDPYRPWHRIGKNSSYRKRGLSSGVTTTMGANIGCVPIFRITATKHLVNGFIIASSSITRKCLFKRVPMGLKDLFELVSVKPLSK